VGRVSKTLPEPDACVSAEGEAGSGEHGVRDHVFAFRPTWPAPTVLLADRYSASKRSVNYFFDFSFLRRASASEAREGERAESL